MRAAVTDNLLLAVADLIAGRRVVAVVAVLAIAVVDRAEVMHSVSEELGVDCTAREGAALARGMAPGALKHRETQARPVDPLMPVEKICSCFDKGVIVRPKARS